MIPKLTTSEESQLRAYSNKWREIRTDTRPLDKPRAQAAIELAYACADRPRPTRFIWLQSPLALKICAANINTRDQLMISDVCHDVDILVYDRLDSREEATREFFTIHAMVDEILYQTSLVSYTPDVQESVWSGLSDSLWEADLGALWDFGLRSTTNWDCFDYGSMASHLGKYDFLREVCGLRAVTDEAQGLLAVAQECGWWVPFAGTALVSSRPVIIRPDLIRYEDGWECNL